MAHIINFLVIVIIKILLHELVSEDTPFRLTRKARITIYILLAIGVSVALFLVFSPASLKQREAFTDFTLGVISLEIGIVLFVIYRRFPIWRKFVESMTLLILFMAPAGLIVPLLLSYGVTIYYFLPTYLACLFGWLFFSFILSMMNNGTSENFGVGYTILFIIGFGLFMLTIGKKLLNQSLPWIQTKLS